MIPKNLIKYSSAPSTCIYYPRDISFSSLQLMYNGLFLSSSINKIQNLVCQSLILYTFSDLFDLTRTFSRVMLWTKFSRNCEGWSKSWYSHVERYTYIIIGETNSWSDPSSVGVFLRVSFSNFRPVSFFFGTVGRFNYYFFFLGLCFLVYWHN